MGLFCGKTCQCKKRCKATFPTNDDLRKGCENYCKADNAFNVADYPCNIAGFNDASFIANYGYDPCAGSGITVDDFTGQDELEAQELLRQERLQKMVYIGVAIVVIALIVLLIMIF